MIGDKGLEWIEFLLLGMKLFESQIFLVHCGTRLDRYTTPDSVE